MGGLFCWSKGLNLFSAVSLRTEADFAKQKTRRPWLHEMQTVDAAGVNNV